MKGTIFGSVIFSILCVLIHAEQDFFKVPVEVREANRPERLVDNTNDPDMVKLKKLQDRFFNIVGNSSAAQDFKSFSQLLKLIDSDSGLELGRLAVNGVMLGFGKENQHELFMEFLDDFKYRVSPHLVDALIDYKDFMKNVDFKLIPLTIQTLFRKDELGNSLAHMPLGQLIDFVQPEASKYGIDIKSTINGILGKGDDKTFPELVEKMMKNFNASSILKGLLGTVSDDKDMEKTSAGQKKKAPMKDPTLMLFRPMIGKLLQDYNIDLEPEAVIQAVTPFMSIIGDNVQKMMNPDGKSEGFNIATLAPMLAMMAAQGGNKNGPNMIQTALSMMQQFSQNNDELSSLLNLASNFLGAGNQQKDSKKQKKTKSPDGIDLEGIANMIGGGDQKGFDPNNLLQMASMFMGNNNNGGPDLGNLLNIASNLMGSLNKPEPTESTKKLNGLFENLAPFLYKLQKDKQCANKIEAGVNLLKLALGEKFSYNELKKSIPEMIKHNKMPNENIDIDTVMGALAFSKEDWRMFLTELEDDDFRQVIIKNSVAPGSDLVAMVISEDFQNRQNNQMKQKFEEAFMGLGLPGKGLTSDNFMDRLKPTINMISMGLDIPVKITTLFDPIKASLKSTTDWYFKNVEILQRRTRTELEAIVGRSLENDFALPILEVAKISGKSSTSPKCIAREICELNNDAEETHPNSLKLLVTRIASIVYGVIRSDAEKDYNLLIEVGKAVSMANRCEKYFPIVCPTAIPSRLEESEKEDKNQHVEL